jgi:predicted double-glycine peptidase
MRIESESNSRASVPARSWLTGMLLLLGLVLGGAGAAAGASLRVATGPLGTGVTLRQPVKSVTELRHENVVAQRLDYSCGSAALSTIFTYYLLEPVAEHEIIEYVLEHGDLEKIIARRGFSLLELKQFAESRGATAEGYAMDFEALASLQGPVLLPIRFTDRLHFVVYRGVRGNRVFHADPALGRWTLSAPDFERLWSPQVGLLIKKGTTAPENSPLAIGEQDRIFLENGSLRTLLLEPALTFTSIAGEF